MNFYLLKEKIISESCVHQKFSDLKVYKFLLLDILSGNEKLADEFMLSKHGGYTKGQLKTIKWQIQRNMIINRAKIESLQNPINDQILLFGQDMSGSGLVSAPSTKKVQKGIK